MVCRVRSVFFSFFVFGVFFFSFRLFGKELEIKVKCPSVLLINADTGAILFQKNADEKRNPASLTKIAAALYAMEKIGSKLDYVFHTPSPDALKVVPKHSPKKPHHLEPDAILMGLKHGEEVALTDLMHAHLIHSACDASNAIAEAVSGSVPQFVSEMNDFLKEKGCKSTHFVNPSGWHHPLHLTSAFDLAIMARLVLANPVLANIVKKPACQVNQTNKNPARTLKQLNKLVVPGHRMHYPYATGMKTGYTSKAGFNLVASASNGERNLIAVIMGASTSNERFEEAQKLFETAFAEKRVQRTLFSADGEVFQFKDEAKKLFFRAKITEDIIHSYYPSEQVGYDAKISWSFKTPIKYGQNVGTLKIFDHRGEKIFDRDLIAIDEVPLTLKDLLQNPWVKRGAIGALALSIVSFLFFKWRRKHQDLSY